MAGNSSRFFLLFFAMVAMSLVCEATPPKSKYWIKFSDKNGTPYSVSSPTAFLTPRAVTRRQKQNIAINFSDLPVTPSYIAQINTIPHLSVLYASKWLNGLVVAVDSGFAIQALSTAKTFSFVTDSSRVKKMRVNYEKNLGPPAGKPLQGASGTTVCGYNYGGSGGQIRQLNVDVLHLNGFRGQGMVVAVLDVGFEGVDSSPVFDSLRNDDRILGLRDFVNGISGSYLGGIHGTYVMSCMAANDPGIAVGGAPLASYWLLKTEDENSETISEEYNWVRGAEFADSVGADILTTSLGYTDFDLTFQNMGYSGLNGRTAPMSIAATMAARKGMLVFSAAGNDGGDSWHYIGVPADADSICAVGAVDTLGRIADFSSYGPTSDGRMKPDLSACGWGTWVCGNSAVCFPGSGTSFATPMLAGAAACFWQAHPDYNWKQVLDTLKKHASNSSHPDNHIGWGIPTMQCKPQSGFTYTIENDGVVKFSAVNTCNSSGYLYTWDFGDGSVANGSVATHVYPSTRQYHAAMKISGGTVKSCDVLYASADVTVHLEVDFTYTYDNKLQNLELNLSKLTYDFVSVEITDMLGKALYSSNEDATVHQININALSLSSDIYIVKVNTSRGTCVKKILVEP